MEQGSWFTRLGRLMHYAGLPAPSWELSNGFWAKAQFSLVLDVRAPREAGFTEQRTPPAPDSGGITGRCTSGPQCLVSLASWTTTFCCFFIHFSYSPSHNRMKMDALLILLLLSKYSTGWDLIIFGKVTHCPTTNYYLNLIEFKV